MEDSQPLDGLTEQERAFCDHLATKGGSYSDAYKATHNCQDMSDSAIYQAASRLARSEACKQYQSALRCVGILTGATDRDEAVKDLFSRAERAEVAGQYGAAAKYTEMAYKANGILGDIATQPERGDMGAAVRQLQKDLGADTAAAVLQRLAPELADMLTDTSPTQH